MSLRKYKTYSGAPVSDFQDGDQGERTQIPPIEADISAARIDEYVKMDDDARWQLLVTKVVQAKRDGMMTDADLDAFASNCRSVLEPAQYERLLAMIAAIKG